MEVGNETFDLERPAIYSKMEIFPVTASTHFTSLCDLNKVPYMCTNQIINNSITGFKLGRVGM